MITEDEGLLGVEAVDEAHLVSVFRHMAQAIVAYLLRACRVLAVDVMDLALAIRVKLPWLGLRMPPSRLSSSDWPLPETPATPTTSRPAPRS